MLLASGRNAEASDAQSVFADVVPDAFLALSLKLDVTRHTLFITTLITSPGIHTPRPQLQYSTTVRQ